MSSRHRRGKPPKQKRAPRTRAPMTDMQRAREHLLIDLGITKSDIARALGLPLYRITNVFTDRNRSLGPEGVEQRVVTYLCAVADRDGIEPKNITLDSMGWAEPAVNETPATGDEAGAGES